MNNNQMKQQQIMQQQIMQQQIMQQQMMQQQMMYRWMMINNNKNMQEILNNNVNNHSSQSINYLEDKPQLQLDENTLNDAISHNKEFFFNPDSGFLYTNAGFCWIMSAFKFFLTNKNFIQILRKFKERHKHDGDRKDFPITFDFDLFKINFTEAEEVAALHCFGYDNLKKDADDNFKRLKRVLYLIGVLCNNIDDDGKINTKPIEGDFMVLSNTNENKYGNNDTELKVSTNKCYNQLYKNIITLFDIDRKYYGLVRTTMLLFLQCMYIMNAEEFQYDAPLLYNNQFMKDFNASSQEIINYQNENKSTNNNSNISPVDPENRIYCLAGQGIHFFNVFKDKNDGEYYINGYQDTTEKNVKKKFKDFGSLMEIYNLINTNFRINEKNNSGKQRLKDDYIGDGYEKKQELIMTFNECPQKDEKEKYFDLNKVYRTMIVDRRHFVNPQKYVIGLIKQEIANYDNNINNNDKIVKTYIDETNNLIIHITNKKKVLFDTYQYYYNKEEGKKIGIKQTNSLEYACSSNNGTINLVRLSNPDMLLQVDNTNDQPEYYSISINNGKIKSVKRNHTLLKTIYDGVYYYNYKSENDTAPQKIDKNNEDALNKFTTVDKNVFIRVNIDNYITEKETFEQIPQEQNISPDSYVPQLNDNNSNQNPPPSILPNPLDNNNQNIVSNDNNIPQQEYDNNNQNLGSVNVFHNNNENQNPMEIFSTEQESPGCGCGCGGNCFKTISNGLSNFGGACMYGLNTCCEAIKRIFTQ